MKNNTMLFVRDRQFYRTMAAIGLPIVMQSIITIGVNFMDTLMVGTQGENALSACSLANSFINIFQILCLGIGGGAAVLTARCWGSGDIENLKKTLTIMLRMCLGISMLFLLASSLFPSEVMRLYTPDAEIIEQGRRYFFFACITFPLIGISSTVTIVLRSVQEVKVPLAASVVSFFLNIFFNWMFIFGHLGAPAMGIAGAALSTLIARSAETMVITGYLFFIDEKVGYRPIELLKSPASQRGRYFKYCLPVVFSDFLLALGNSMVATIMGHIGSSFVAANAAVMQVVAVSTICMTAMSSAASIMTGNTLGQGDGERAYRDGITFMCVGGILGVISGIAIILLCPLIVSFFSFSGETLRIADMLMYSVAILTLFDFLQGALTKGVLRGGGDTKFLLVADTIFLWLVSLPLGYLAGLVWQLSPFWIYTCLKADRVIKVFLCAHRLRSRKWIKKV